MPPTITDADETSHESLRLCWSFLLIDLTRKNVFERVREGVNFTAKSKACPKLSKLMLEAEISAKSLMSHYRKARLDVL